MFCSNCGKEIRDGDNFCESCGKMVRPGENAPNRPPFEPSDNSQSLEPSGNLPAVRKDKTGKTAAIIIGVVSGAVILLCIIAVITAASIASLSGRGHNNDHFDGYGDFDDRDDYDDFFDRFFDDDDDDLYPGYGKGGSADNGSANNGSADNGSAAAPGATAIPDDSLPPDSNGKTYDDPDYQWPTGDGTYEFYAKSTIPKFESVTGKPCTDTDVENGNTYYEYDMDMDAYNAYIKALEDAGYTQTKFDVQGRDSYVRYDKGAQYLIIYQMNSDNEIVIMA